MDVNFLRYRGELVQKFTQRMAALQVVNEIFEGHVRPLEARRSIHDFRVGHDDEAFHKPLITAIWAPKRIGPHKLLNEQELTLRTPDLILFANSLSEKGHPSNDVRVAPLRWGRMGTNSVRQKSCRQS